MKARPRGTTNRNARGGTDERRRRREWLVVTFGDGELVDCSIATHPDCWVAMTKWTVSADRWPIPGAEGGTYRRDNIRPACSPCQSSSGGLLGNARKRARRRA